MSLGSLLQVKIVFIYVNFDNLSSVGVSRCPISLNGGIFVFSWLFDFNFMSYFYINTLNPTENHYPQWYRKSLTRHNSGKCLWIIHPACVFLQIGVPSLTLVYILHETTISSQVLSKAIDHSSIGLVSIQIGGLNPPLLDIIIIQSQLLRRLLGAYDY